MSLGSQKLFINISRENTIKESIRSLLFVSTDEDQFSISLKLLEGSEVESVTKLYFLQIKNYFCTFYNEIK